MFYDPFCPIVSQLRLIFHKICTRKYNWNTELPSNFVTLWNKLIKELKVLEGVPVNCHVLCKWGNDTDVHGFCESSGKTYSAFNYILSRCCHGVMVNLVASKCRLASSKLQTIPRLKLLSCLLLSKMLDSGQDGSSQVVTVSSIFCWSDSIVALWWIKKFEKRNIWVQNRVNVIRADS